MVSDKTNEVDVSPERIDKELRAAATEEDLIYNNQAGNSENSEPQPEQLSEEQQQNTLGNLAFFLSFGFGIAFSALAPAWNIQKEQNKNLGVAWARVCLKYLPFSWLEYVPNITGGTSSDCVECDALLLTYSTIEPVYMSPRFQDKSESQPENPEADIQKQSGQPQDTMKEVHQI